MTDEGLGRELTPSGSDPSDKTDSAIVPVADADSRAVERFSVGPNGRVRVVPALGPAQPFDDVSDARLAARSHLAHDHGGEWAENVFEVGGPGHAIHRPHGREVRTGSTSGRPREHPGVAHAPPGPGPGTLAMGAR